MVNKEDFAEAIELYKDWNSRINVISRKDIDNVFEHHILHSLAINEFASFEEGSTVLDLGTGGGFPGIPLAMTNQKVRFTLCDSIGKKTKVASSIAEALGLGNVEVVNARAETLPGQFDYVVSRAVTTLSEFYPWVKGKFRKSIYYLKGGDVNEEIAELLKKYGLRPSSVSVFRIDSIYKDEYFREKFVIQIEKS